MKEDIEDIVLAKLAGQELERDGTERFDLWYAEEANRQRYESLLRMRSGIVASRGAGVDAGKAWRNVYSRMPRQSARRRIMRYAAAIAIPLLVAVGYLAYRSQEEAIVVKPGEGRAFFSSSSGREYLLTDAAETAFDDKGEIKVYGNPEAKSHFSGSAESKGVINTIAVPRGGHWNVVLDDGSQVWLNCESTLKFPHCFDRGRRVVELEGEAYFRIAKDEGRPFIVQTRDYDIEVTGTEFNVNSYSPNSTSTTLVEGGVKIELDGAANILTPGCRAVMTGNGIMVEEVEVDKYLAWRSDEFLYRQTSLDKIVDDLARWYDIDIVWKDDSARENLFTAGFSRSSELSAILDVLEKTNSIDMTLKGRTLTIRDV